MPTAVTAVTNCRNAALAALETCNDMIKVLETTSVSLHTSQGYRAPRRQRRHNERRTPDAPSTHTSVTGSTITRALVTSRRNRMHLPRAPPPQSCPCPALCLARPTTDKSDDVCYNDHPTTSSMFPNATHACRRAPPLDLSPCPRPTPSLYAPSCNPCAHSKTF